MWVSSLSEEDHLEKEIATHSSILAWRITRIGEPDGLQSMGSQRVGRDLESKQQQLPYLESKEGYVVITESGHSTGTEITAEAVL